jgi:lysophospholipase L1-like esterase
MKRKDNPSKGRLFLGQIAGWMLIAACAVAGGPVGAVGFAGGPIGGCHGLYGFAEGRDSIGPSAGKWRFNFDPLIHRVGYTEIMPSTVYTDQLGYGFDFGTRASSPPFYFSVRVPEGNYNVTVTLGGGERASATTIKAECRRLMVEKVVTGKGKFATRTFTVHIRDSIIHEPVTPNPAAGTSGTSGAAGTSAAVAGGTSGIGSTSGAAAVGRVPASGTPVRLKSREYAFLHWDNKLTLEFSNSAPRISAIEIAPAGPMPTIFLAGNSTVVDQAEEPWAAWGQMIPVFFQPGKIAVANYAESGETLKAFVGERRLAKVWSMARPGDYLFIEFAHNDQKPGSSHLDPFTTYKEEISQYIGEARRRGMIPVLVTSMHRRNFDAAGHVVNTLGDYPEAMRQEAKELNVALVDLNAMSKQLYEAWGPEQSVHAFVHYPAHTFPGQEKELKDDTHFNSYGAYELAKCVAKGIKENIPELAGYLVRDLPGFDPNHPDPLGSWSLPMSGKISVRKPDGN